MSENISAVHNVTEHCMFANSLLRACRTCRVGYKLSSRFLAATRHCSPKRGRLQGLQQQQPSTYCELTKTVGPGTLQVHGKRTRDSCYDWSCWHRTPTGSATKTRNSPAKSGLRHQTFSSEGVRLLPCSSTIFFTEAATGFTARRWHLRLAYKLLCV